MPHGASAVIISAMSVDDTDAVTFGLRLTGPELKITYTALRALRDDLGRHEADVNHIVQAVLDKLPDEHTIRAIRIGDER
ncbi:MAG: hypothetical protein QOG59_1319 [Solirubrobacteraceae bacterium]|nr:hypothetical protein [Solirubrobacteraceae bacterium]